MFDDIQEEWFYNHVKSLDIQLMLLNKAKFLKLVYQFPEKLNINQQFNKEKQMRETILIIIS